MANRIEVQLKMEAPRSLVWKMLTDISLWEKWYGVPVTAADWREGGSISFGGQYATVSPIKQFRDGESFVVEGPWVDNAYALRDENGGTIMSRTDIGKGATWIDAKVPEEKSKKLRELAKLKKMIEEADLPNRIARAEKAAQMGRDALAEAEKRCVEAEKNLSNLRGIGKLLHGKEIQKQRDMALAAKAAAEKSVRIAEELLQTLQKGRA